MAVPTYTTDLADIDLCEAGGKTWAEPTATGWTGGAAPADDDDNPFQGSYAKSKAYNAVGVGGMLVNNTAAISLPTDGAILGWFYWAAPGSLYADVDGGIRMIAGSDLANFLSWDLGGKTSYVYGGWINYAYNTGLTPDDTVGTGLGNSQYVGAAINNFNSIFKGSPFLCDAFRYGRAEARINGGQTANYATFSGFAAVNDSTTYRWGLIQEISGGYLWKGLMTLGYTSVVDFRDSNVNIFVQETRKVTSSFNKIEIRQATSRVDWTGVNFICTNPTTTASKGALEVVDNATVNLNACTFTDMDTFIFQSNSTILNSTFRRCGQITGGGAAFNGCLFTTSPAAVSLVLTNLNQVTDCNFVSDGSNHAINLGTISATISMNWNNYLTGYATSDGSSGNEAILVSVSSGQTLTINVGAGYSTPSIYNTGPGTVTVVSGQVTTSVTVKDLITGNLIDGARVLVWATNNANKFYNASVAISGSGTTATVTHAGHGLVTGDKVIISGVTNDDDYNGVFSITYISSSSYSYTADDTLTSPATGTPVAKWAIISGLTNASGYIEDVRSFGSAQLITGWVRQTSGSPYYYQEGAISGTISIANGFNSTIQLVRDE